MMHNHDQHAAVARLQTAARTLNYAKSERLAAIDDARAQGITMKRIASALGLTPTGVYGLIRTRDRATRQMDTPKP